MTESKFKRRVAAVVDAFTIIDVLAILVLFGLGLVGWMFDLFG